MNIVFDTRNIYYIPQYTPIVRELIGRGHKCLFLCYESKDIKTHVEAVLLKEDFNIPILWTVNQKTALEEYRRMRPDWVILANSFDYLDELHNTSKTAQLAHGIGPKACYYSITKHTPTIRFIEGAERLEKIKGLYPDGNYALVGYSKLDPLFQREGKATLPDIPQLDSLKKTILYAPTFNPSSLEQFPDNWPEVFNEYNIIIKPHTFVYTREKYRKQREKLRCWAKFDNTMVADKHCISLLPFMEISDILVSEASSALFEFVALDKPVVVCNFYKLNWSYKGPFKYRFKKRFATDHFVYSDIGTHVRKFKELKSAVVQNLSDPGMFSTQRRRYTENHVGLTDGKVSARIADHLETYQA